MTLQKKNSEIWEDALYLGEAGRAIRGHEIQYYVQLLQSVREESLKYLSEQSDEWLVSERKWPNGVIYNQHYLWYHVLEDEISHRGQIRMLKRKLFENYVK